MTTVATWYSPTSLVTHLSERCARTQGRPARENAVEARDLMAAWEGSWCERCAGEDKRARLLERGHR